MPDVEVSRSEHVAHVRLNRPDSLNAISQDMDEDLLQAWEEINRDPAIRVAVLSAEGERAFSVGADLSGGERIRRLAFGGGITGVGGQLITLRKPLVAAVQGYVLGGGLELALCADVIISADTAVFGIPEASMGIMGESGIMHRAIRQLPYRVALAMILTGERLAAERALSLGLVNEVVPFDDLDAVTEIWVQKLLAASPLAVQAAKDAVLSRRDWPLEIALGTRYESIEAYASSEDALESRQAWEAKRPPRWKGR